MAFQTLSQLQSLSASRMPGSQIMRYPSPYLDIGSTYYPQTIRELLQLCRLFYWTHPVISATINKLARYPVTDVVFSHAKSDAVVHQWTELMCNILRIRSFLIRMHLDVLTLGSAFITIIYPFKRLLKCQRCGQPTDAKQNFDHWEYMGGRFILQCPKCKHRGAATVDDLFIRNLKGVKLHLWDPMDVIIEDAEYPGTTRYMYRIPRGLSSAIRLGKKAVVSQVPMWFIDAVEKSKMVVFNPSNFMHVKRQVVSGKHKGWGMPLIANVLKWAFYLQIMMKTNECVAPESLLDTETGLRRADSLRVGDRVKVHTGQLRRIIALRRRPIIKERGDHTVRVAASALRPWPSTFSDNHPLLLLRRNSIARRKDTKDVQPSTTIRRLAHLYSWRWVEACDVKVGDYVGYPTARQKDVTYIELSHYLSRVMTEHFVYGDKTLHATAVAYEALSRGEWVKHDNAGRVAKRWVKKSHVPSRLPRQLPLTEDLAYIAGWYLGDGSVGGRFTMFSLGPEDDGIVLKSAIRRVFGCSSTLAPRKRSRGCDLVVSNALMTELFRNWIPGEAPQKRIPDEILRAPDSILHAFLRGYTEAGGCRLTNRTMLAYTISSEQLAYQLWWLFLSMGCVATVGTGVSKGCMFKNALGETIKIRSGLRHYAIGVYGPSSTRLAALLDGREAEPVTGGKTGFFFGPYFAARIHKVRRVVHPEVISIEVESDHTFCTPGMATHNTIMIEHMVPLRILFPQAPSTMADPFNNIWMTRWKEKVEEEIRHWRQDQLYIPVVPLPVGAQSIGGEGRALMLNAEIRMLLEQLVAAMEVPLEFVFSGTSYSASMVSMRQLENLCLGMVEDDREVVRWIIENVSAYMRIDRPDDFSFKPFKMADDLTRRQVYIALYDRGLVSGHAVCAMNDLDYSTEAEMRAKEAESDQEAQDKRAQSAATAQGKALVITSTYQVQAQAAAAQKLKALGQGPLSGTTPPGGIGGPQSTEQPSPSVDDVLPTSGLQPTDAQFWDTGQGMAMSGSGVHVPAQDLARQVVLQLRDVDPKQREQYMMDLKAQMPQLHGLVMEQMATPIGRELPDQRPPRRELPPI